MKLTRLIELHRQNLGPHDLADNFGDGILVRNNRIYGKIRAAALQAGFRFSSEPHAGYNALPFAQLESLLASKSIPYTNNVTVIEKLVAQLKDDVVWDDISDGLRKNFVFHEACHAVARCFANTNKPENPKAKAFRMMMEESFANTCEFLAVADAEDAAHRIFFELNSYTALFDQKTHIKNSFRDVGFDRVFKILWLAYMHSNYLHEQLDDKQWRRCLAIADAESLPAPQIKSLKMLARIAFTLDPRFRLVTTRFHFKLNGIQMAPQEIVNFDILSEGSLQEFLQSACNTLK